MTDPMPLRVLKNLTATLQAITPAAGYRHDLSAAVFRGRMLFTPEDPIPMVSIQQPPKVPEEIEAPGGAPIEANRHMVLVQGFAEDDRQNPTDPAYLLLDDVKRRLLWERSRDDGFNVFGMGAAVQLHLGQGVVRSPDQHVSDVAFFWLPITLEYAENLA